jgi:Uma2 family endonuclease
MSLTEGGEVMRLLFDPALPSARSDPRYPESDGKPMAETPIHVAAIIWLYQALEDLFARRKDVFLAANIFFYYKFGNPKKRTSPDVLVAKGVGNHLRRSFRLWEEKFPPAVLFEISSKKTWREDLGRKRRLYARLGVAEYFLFDPDHKYLKPPLQGFRLVGGKSVRIQPAEDGSLLSVELGVRLKAEGDMVRLIHARTGKPILKRSEQVQQARKRAAREKKRVEEMKDRADQEKDRADQEKDRADQLAAEVERLRKLLGKGEES